MRSPERRPPDRIRLRKASCARTVCDTERSASRSFMVLFRRLHTRWRGLAGDHPVDHPPRPHRAGIDVEIVEDTFRIFVHRALLRFENDLVLAEDAGNAFADFGGQLLLGEAMVAHECPEIMTGGRRLRRHGVEHITTDALRTIALRRTGPRTRHADIDVDGAGGLEVDDLPAIDQVRLWHLH